MFTACQNCRQSYNLLLTSEDAHLLDQIRDSETTCPCPRLCGSSVSLVESGDLQRGEWEHPVTLTGQELYRAVNGMGLPDEVPHDPIVVDSLLKSGKVTRTLMEDIGGRLYLHEISLDNGATIHFSSAAKGACVLKITKEIPNAS